MKDINRNYRPFILASLIILSSVPLGVAKDLYVTQNSAGTASGADAADANSLAWLNTAANWGSGATQVSPGDKVHLVGTFTSPLTVMGSGVSGSPMTIYFEPGANFTSPCWPYGIAQAPNGAIAFYGVSNIVIDGGVNGIIQNTACGTAFTNKASTALSGTGRNVTIQNLTVTNIYLRTSYDDYPGLAAYYYGGVGINLAGNALTVSNCHVSDAGSLLSMNASDAFTSNLLILNNTLLNANHFCSLGIPPSTTISNTVISGNIFDHADFWDGGGGGDGLHMDYIIFEDSDNSSVTNDSFLNLYICNNTFGANYMADLSVLTNQGYTYLPPPFNVWSNSSTGIVASHGQTAIIASYMSEGCQEIQNSAVFNNLLLTHTNETWGNTPLTFGGSNVYMVNNTCVAIEGNSFPCGGGMELLGSNVYVYNNICFPGFGATIGGMTSDIVDGGNNGPNVLFILTNYLSTVWSDYNVIQGAGGIEYFGFTVARTFAGGNAFPGLSLTSLQDWQTYKGNEWGDCATVPSYNCGALHTSVNGLYYWCQVHADPHSTTNMPNYMAGTFAPAMYDNVAQGKGTNLTSVFASLGIPATDFYGMQRSPTNRWDIGAFAAGDTNAVYVGNFAISANYVAHFAPLPPGNLRIVPTD